MAKNTIITVKGTNIAIIKQFNGDYLSLTDMVKNFGDESILYNWLRNRNTIEFLGIGEQINNPGLFDNDAYPIFICDIISSGASAVQTFFCRVRRNQKRV